MPNEENKKLADLRTSLNEASKHSQSAILVFAVFLAFFTFSVLGTTSVQMLTGTIIAIPVFNVSVTLVIFYWVVPFVVLLMHLYVLLQLSQIVHLAKRYHRELGLIPLQHDRDHERDLLFPFLPVMMFLNDPRRFFFRAGAQFLTIFSVGFVPPLVLFACQARFIPYHSHAITWAHEGMIAADLLLVGTVGLWAFAHESIFRRKDLKRGIWVHAFDLVPAAYTIAFVVGIFYLSWFVDLIPDIDRPVAAFGSIERKITNAVYKVFPPNIELPDGFSLADAAKASGGKIDLVNRDLVGMVAGGADFSGATFDRTQLREASLFRSNFNGATLDGADLRGAHLMGTSFNGAHLYDVFAGGAYFNEAEFIGATIIGGYFNFASFGRATITSSYLFHPDFTGANFNDSKLTGLVLSGDFSATSYRRAELTAVVPGFQWIVGARKQLKPPISWSTEMGPGGPGRFNAADFRNAVFGDVDFGLFDLSAATGMPSQRAPGSMDGALKEASDELKVLPEGAAQDGARQRLEFALQRWTGAAAATSIFPQGGEASVAASADEMASRMFQSACRDEWYGRGLVMIASEQGSPFDERWKVLIQRAATQTCPSLAKMKDAFLKLMKQDSDYVSTHPHGDLMPASSTEPPKVH